MAHSVLDTVAIINSKLVDENGGEAVLELLRQLQAVPMTFHVLEATKIGRAVNALRKNASSEPARDLAAALYRRWKALAEEHFRSTRRQSPPSETTAVSGQQKLAPTSANPEDPIKGATKSKSVTCSSRTIAKPSRSISDTATVVAKQRSTQLSDASRHKADQPAAVATRQRVVQRAAAAAVPNAAPASSKPRGSDVEEASPPAATAIPGGRRTLKIIIKRPKPLTNEAKPAATAPTEPPKPSGSSSCSKRKEAPTTTGIDEEIRFATVKRRLQERYKEAADAKEKRRIKIINVPGKPTTTQRRHPHAPSSSFGGGARRGASQPLVR